MFTVRSIFGRGKEVTMPCTSNSYDAETCTKWNKTNRVSFKFIVIRESVLSEL